MRDASVGLDGERRPARRRATRRGRVAWIRPWWQTVPVDDEELLSRAEQALTEIKVAQGLSEHHASVLAALRIRLKGSAGKSLEEMLDAAGDLESDRLAQKMAEIEGRRKPSLDDLLNEEPQPKREWPG